MRVLHNTTAEADGYGAAVFPLPSDFHAVYAARARVLLDQSHPLVRIHVDGGHFVVGHQVLDRVVAEHGSEGRIRFEKLSVDRRAVNTVEGVLNERSILRL